MEQRYLTTEVRASANGKTLYGRAASFNRLSTDPNLGFREKIQRGAFRKSLQNRDDVKCLFNHNPSALLGRMSSGTLRCVESEDGLDFECDLPNTQAGNDVRELCTRGDLNECSFGFICDEDDWQDGTDDDGNRCAIRTLRSVQLLDVSVVTNPAYSGSTKANVRSLFVGEVPYGVRLECRSRGIVLPSLDQVEQDARNIVRAHMLSQEVERDAAEQRRREAVAREQQILS